MKLKLNSKQIAMSGILTALSVVFFFLSYYFPRLSLSFNVVLSLIVLTGFTAGGYGVALFITLATAVIGIFVTNFIFVLPYILFFGTVSIVSCLTREKIKNKVISIIVRIVYYTAVVTLVYLFCDVISGETLKAILSKGIAYEIVFCLLGIILLYIYELCLNYVKPMIADRIKRITKK